MPDMGVYVRVPVSLRNQAEACRPNTCLDTVTHQHVSVTCSPILQRRWLLYTTAMPKVGPLFQRTPQSSDAILSIDGLPSSHLDGVVDVSQHAVSPH